MKSNYSKIFAFVALSLFSGLASAYCSTGYYQKSFGKCYLIGTFAPSPPAPPNACQSGYNLYAGLCLATVITPSAWITTPQCFPSYSYDSATSSCMDSNGINYDPLVYPFGGSVYVCPAGQVYQTSTSTCVTPPTCSPSETYDSATNTCLANAGSTVSSAVVVHVLPAVYNSLLNDVIDLFDIVWLAILAIFLWFILFRIFKRSANEAS